jgi:hypothetical protein
MFYWLSMKRTAKMQESNGHGRGKFPSPNDGWYIQIVKRPKEPDKFSCRKKQIRHFVS